MINNCLNSVTGIHYQTSHMTSPPTPFFLASRSVITPLDVEIIAIPRPFNTLGSFSAQEYCLKPGFDTRLIPRMMGLSSFVYLKKTRISLPKGQKVTENLKLLFNPMLTAQDGEYEV